MRNLKKILALVLALVMSLSLMATASAKDFPDKADIDATGYQTAVDVLAELKVVRGYEDGSFKPNGDITRAEVAAIVYRIATKDVEDTQQSIYTTWGKFDDVKNGAWYAGYVNYCANAEIVKGKTATTFDPNDYITGYQVLAMILRTMGYGKNGEFEGPNWAINTAAQAKKIGIIDNILEQKLGDNATRAMVAEILFRAMLTSTVDYNPITGYVPNGNTLGQTQFGLEKVTGVVMANEWANLEAESVVKAGTTVMKVDGKNVTLDKGTDLDAVGLTYNAYISNGEGGVKKALTLEEGANTVAFNEGKATGTTETKDREWASIAKLAATEGIDIVDSTEFFVDYDQAWNDECTSDYVIRYAVATSTYTAASAEGKYLAGLPSSKCILRDVALKDADGNTSATTQCYVVTIKPTGKITKMDQDIMQDIFYGADRLSSTADLNDGTRDYVMGEVYVGTTSNKDYSDTMSWKAFKAEYFNETKTSRRFASAENGESLRVIDNNGDGSAEYVLKIQYTMDQVTGSWKDAPELSGFRVAAKYKDNNLYMPDELAAGTVVVYSVIDGKLSIWPAEVLTDTITTKTFSNITVTTAGGEVKGQSRINNLTSMDQLIMEMNDKTQYNMYLDRFGFIRAYELATGSQYALLTEMYPGTNQNYNYVQSARVTAEMKMGEADVDEYNVANRDGSVFYSGYAWTSRNTRYHNADLNYLQPAIAHLGLAKQFEGATKDAINTTTNAYTLVDWNRTVWEMATETPASVTNPYGVFDYGQVKYDANSKTGQTAVNVANSFSFTNVAAYSVDDDNNVTLSTAAKLYKNRDNEQVYYVTADLTTTGTKTWLSKWIEDGGTKATFDAAVTAGALTPVYAEDYVQLRREDVKAGTVHYTIPSDYTTKFSASNNGYVDATVNTEFYIVMPGSISYKVGYNELPTIKAANVRAAYAVAKNTTAADNGRDYWVADVIVIEVSGLEYAFDSISLMYNNPFEMSSSVRWIDSLNNKWHTYQPDSTKMAEMQVVPSSVVNPADPDSGWGNQAWFGDDYGFYGLKQVEFQGEGELTAKQVELITKDWNKNGIFAGTVQRIKGILNSSGYIDVDLTGAAYDGTLPQYPNVKHLYVRDVPVYRIDEDTAGQLTLSESNAYNEVALGDEIIWVFEQGSTTKLSFIVDLADTYDDDGAIDYSADAWLWSDYRSIIGEQNPGDDRTPVEISFDLAAGEEAVVTCEGTTYPAVTSASVPQSVEIMVSNVKEIKFTLKLANLAALVSTNYRFVITQVDGTTDEWNVTAYPKTGTQIKSAVPEVGTAYTVAAVEDILNKLKNATTPADAEKLANDLIGVKDGMLEDVTHKVGDADKDLTEDVVAAIVDTKTAAVIAEIDADLTDAQVEAIRAAIEKVVAGSTDKTPAEIDKAIDEAIKATGIVEDAADAALVKAKEDAATEADEYEAEKVAALDGTEEDAEAAKTAFEAALEAAETPADVEKALDTYKKAIDKAIKDDYATELPEAPNGVVTLTKPVVLAASPDLTGVTKIDLAGFNITFDKALVTTGIGNKYKEDAIVLGSDQELEITGKGTIALDPSSGDKHVIGLVGNAKLTIGANVTLQTATAQDEGENFSSAIAIHQAGDGAVVNMNGTLSGLVGMIVGFGADNCVVNVNGTIDVEDWGIYFSGASLDNVLNIKGGSVYGTLGGIEISGGTLNATGGKISYGEGGYTEVDIPSQGGTSTIHAAISVAPNKAAKVAVNVNGSAVLQGNNRLGFNGEKYNVPGESAVVTFINSIVDGKIAFIDRNNWEVGEPNAIGEVTISLKTA